MKCNEHTIQTDKGYPIQNFMSSSCIGEEMRQIQMNLIDKNQEASLKIYPDKVILKGNELIYNIFNFDDEMYISDRTLVIDIPPYSFAIINMDIIDIDHLNISNIVFANDRVSLQNLIFNFYRTNEIKYEIKDLNGVSGSLLAPHAKFYIRGNEHEKKLIRGQIFAGEINAEHFVQECHLFEPFF